MRIIVAASLLLLGICPLALVQEKSAATPKEGILPVGADGKPLNLDFETGTLKDWTAEGEAFRDQPIKGDTVFPRRSDNKSQHQGNYWIGGYERRGDKPQGTLTSVPFKVTHPWASFLVGGGPHLETCVELVRKDTGKVFHRASGYEEENLRREVVDLKPHMDKEIFIRLVDRHSGHWGHINFDDFRFHSDKPDFPKRPTVQPPPPLDNYKYAGLPPKKAAEVMTVPEGFNVTLFAGEPDVVQPVAMCLDDRGRVWVAEGHCYPIRRKAKGPNSPFVADGVQGDRIGIFEDTDGDGTFDKKTVFMEGLNLVSGIEVGFGGVWIGAAPYLMFIPAKDDKPAGPPQILLDGWHYEDTHETLNAFTWGPDGWLYGCHGGFTHSLVGKPGTLPEKRTPINAGIWRYHPTRHEFEVFAHGTSNPWGLDFNEYGDCFVEACVIPHLFHIVQGGRYNRQAGQHFNPYTYADIQTIADHRHYVGPNPHGGNNRSDSMGGGHAHCGLMCYLGGTWPKEYHSKLFMGNVHGRRINVDVLTPQGSGYVASHGNDFLIANDAWARFINLKYGPDGNVYLIDWYDKQICHLPQPEVWDRTNGRIYKISHNDAKPVKGVDLSKCTDEELVKYQLHENDWYARTARRLLQERAARQNPDAAQRESMRKARVAAANITDQDPNPRNRLRGLFAFQVTGGLNTVRTSAGLADHDEHVRAWTVQFVMEDEKEAKDWLDKLTELAGKDPSQVVRRALASGLQRLPLERRWELYTTLVRHPEDVRDPNLPYLYWYAAEPLATLNANRALHESSHSVNPQLLEFMARRVAAIGTPEALAEVVGRLGNTDHVEKQLAILRGTNDALKGKRNVAMPVGWDKAYEGLAKSASAEVRGQAMALGVVFGDKTVLATLRKMAADPNTELFSRADALGVLIQARDAEVVPVLQKLVTHPQLRTAAIRGLAAFDDAKTPGAILAEYPNFTLAEKRDALATLAARVGFAKELMNAIGAKKLPAADIPAEIVRQLRGYQDASLDKQIADLWGVVRESPAERKALIASWKKRLTASTAPPGDVNLGRAVFAKTCLNCQKRYAVGGKGGPAITAE